MPPETVPGMLPTSRPDATVDTAGNTAPTITPAAVTAAIVGCTRAAIRTSCVRGEFHSAAGDSPRSRATRGRSSSAVVVAAPGAVTLLAPQLLREGATVPPRAGTAPVY